MKGPPGFHPYIAVIGNHFQFALRSPAFRLGIIGDFMSHVLLKVLAQARLGIGAEDLLDSV